MVRKCFMTVGLFVDFVRGGGVIWLAQGGAV